MTRRPASGCPHLRQATDLRRFVKTAVLGALCVAGLGLQPAAAQKKDPVAEQQRVIRQLEQQIAAGEKELAGIKQDRTSAQRRVQQLAGQIEARNELLTESEAQERQLIDEVVRADSLVGELNASLVRHRAQYGEMVREAYRNHAQNNYLTYLFASKDFTDMARRIASLREAAALRARQIDRIDSLNREAARQLTVLSQRQQELDSVRRSLTAQKEKLQRDAAQARTSLNRLSKQEKSALQRANAQKKRLDDAVAQLRKLTKGNKEGASFSTQTSNLNLPVEGGRVKAYHGNMAEITGPRGARVRSIYEGKVVDVKRNRITNKYDIYIAHGEYITSYANLSAATVAKGDAVARNAAIGVIGSSVDMETMKNEYKLIFGIYPPSPTQKMSAASCFKK